MINTFNDFKSNFENRFNQQSILNLGEDSVRYDFFISFMNNYKLEPYDIQVEFPINPNAFTPNLNPNSKRKENPQIDLYCMHPIKVITAEFGLFKRNGNPDGIVNSSEKIFKMLNDMLRLSLNKIYVPNESFFICVADSTILGTQMRNNILPAFPSALYSFDYNDINNWVNTIKSAESKFDSRFVHKANQLGLTINAELIYNQAILNPGPPLSITNNLETRVLVYKINEVNQKNKDK
jgi:hypothetical protein